MSNDKKPDNNKDMIDMSEKKKVEQRDSSKYAIRTFVNKSRCQMITLEML